MRGDNIGPARFVFIVFKFKIDFYEWKKIRKKNIFIQNLIFPALQTFIQKLFANETKFNQWAKYKCLLI